MQWRLPGDTMGGKSPLARGCILVNEETCTDACHYACGISAKAGSGTEGTSAEIAELRDLQSTGIAAKPQLASGIQLSSSLFCLACRIRNGQCHRKRKRPGVFTFAPHTSRLTANSYLSTGSDML